MKITVAMSGGVDSSVAAALLKEQGHEVSGATMLLRPLSNGDDKEANAAIDDARRAAEKIGIPHRIYDFRDIFAGQIIEYFCREYYSGRTPNPCVLCNREIKFGALWEKAREEGADLIATGHYARIEQAQNRFLLKKGADEQKEQSYFLYRLTQEQLSHTAFPLADLTKDKVKQIAREMALPIAERPESQEICFIADDNYINFLNARERKPVKPEPGLITDRTGKKLGEHRGIANYTIGQRKGLGIAATEPLYVIGIDAASNTLIVGTKEETYTDTLIATDLNWIAIPPPLEPITIKAKVRYRHREAEATVSPTGDNEVYVKFTEPQTAVTPGQSVVFYEGDTVIGGGTITRQGR